MQEELSLTVEQLHGMTLGKQATALRQRLEAVDPADHLEVDRLCKATEALGAQFRLAEKGDAP